jgi:dihydrofolate reductase
MIGLIVAVAENGVIGQGNKIPWFYRGELKWFKETTVNGVVIMGRKTWESLWPKNRPLRGRLNIVVTSSTEPFEGALVARSLDQAVNMAQAVNDNIWLIGGHGIYKEGLPLADVIFVTRIPVSVEAGDDTVYFPEIDDQRWVLQSYQSHPYVDYLIIEAWGLR